LFEYIFFCSWAELFKKDFTNVGLNCGCPQHIVALLIRDCNGIGLFREDFNNIIRLAVFIINNGITDPLNELFAIFGFADDLRLLRDDVFLFLC
jgi:hypothetical protein